MLDTNPEAGTGGQKGTVGTLAATVACSRTKPSKELVVCSQSLVAAYSTNDCPLNVVLDTAHVLATAGVVGFAYKPNFSGTTDSFDLCGVDLEVICPVKGSNGR